jgi:hypothetical protein
MLSIVIGPSLILNSTLAPEPGLPWYFNRLRSTGLPSAMLMWCGPSWPTSTKPSRKSIGWNSAKLPPMSSRSMISMAMHVFRSDSPHIGNPAAVSSELPTIKLVTSVRSGLLASPA